MSMNQNPGIDLSDVAEQHAWDALAVRIAREDSVRPARHINRVWWGWWGTAAAAVLLVSIGVAAWQFNIFTGQPATQPETVYRTLASQRAEVTLADGSKIVLAPATTLRARGRTINLDGQAMFTVVHNEGKPFEVISRGVRTTVLGTTFGVRAYDSSVKVVVSQGKVAVNTQTLTAGDIATVVNSTTNVQHNADVSSELAFSRGELVLRDVPLPEAIPDLNRWYNTDIRLADKSLNELRLSATFATGSSAELIQLLEPTLQVRIQRSGSRLTLYSRQ